MKTIGQLLRKARKQKKITISRLARITKIDQRFILALEKDEYHALPSSTFIKGFIRNLSLALDQNPDNLIAIFRRDYKASLPGASIKRKKLTKLKLLRPQLLLVIFSFLIFLSYLGFQYRAVLIPPQLTIVQPQNNQVLTSPFSLEGRTSADSIVSINFAPPFSPDQSGYFLKTLELPPGQYDIAITATNRFNRTSSVKISITVISSN